jgi:hypothetical protein
MENKQTAVQWLVEKLMKGEYINDPEYLITQAKAMEKEQIIEAYCMGDDNIGAEQYYNETFKSK